MKIYLTKPRHTKYGTIKLETYSSLELLMDDATVWFDPPKFQKPILCIFESELVWYGFNSKISGSHIKLKYLPEGEVKEACKALIRKSFNSGLTESLCNRHYKWIGELDIILEHSQDFTNHTLYVIKPDPVEISFAGIDRTRIYFERPKLQRYPFYNDNTYNYQFELLSNNYLNGLLFRKNKDLKIFSTVIWKDIVNSFDIGMTYDEMDDLSFFYNTINKENHKKGMSSKRMILEYNILFKLKGNLK